MERADLQSSEQRLSDWLRTLPANISPPTLSQFLKPTLDLLPARWLSALTRMAKSSLSLKSIQLLPVMRLISFFLR